MFHLRTVCLLLSVWLYGSTLQAEKTWLFVSLLEDKKIVAYERDADTGRLTRRGETVCSAEPGILYPSRDRKTLFVAMRSSGELASFRIDASDGSLQQVSKVDGGADPCYFFQDYTSKYLFCAYYVAAKVTVHRVNESGEISERPVQEIATATKAHAIELDPTNRMAFVPHTGPNRVFQFSFDEKTGRLTASHPKAVLLSPGDEPRHVQIHPTGNWVYANNEAGDGINAFEVNRDQATLTRFQKLTTLPNGFDAAKNTTARCEMTADGKFIYVANRGSHTIAAFAINAESGELSERGIYPTEETPRSLTITPDGKFLYAAGQDNGRVALYEIVSDGRLRQLKTYDVGPIPWSVLAVDLP